MYFVHIDNTEQLAYLIERLIRVIRYDNENAYRLLKKVTLGKSAVIQLDESRIMIQAQSSNNEEYFVISQTKDQTSAPVFLTTATTLKRIMAGATTIDKAIADHEIYLQGCFEDVIDIYRLSLYLLSDGPRNPNLQKLWEFFCETWNPERNAVWLQPLENQIARYDEFVAVIPRNVLFIGLE
jgi:hypothetical protein